MERYTSKFGGRSGLKDRYCIKAKEVSVIDGKIVGEPIDRLAGLEEKMIPKKVVRQADGSEHCPNCDLDNSSFGFGVCVDCGQKLDWSDYEG